MDVGQSRQSGHLLHRPPCLVLAGTLHAEFVDQVTMVIGKAVLLLPLDKKATLHSCPSETVLQHSGVLEYPH